MNLLESKTVLPDSNGVQSLTPALPPHLPSNGADLCPTEVKYIIPYFLGELAARMELWAVYAANHYERDAFQRRAKQYREAQFDALDEVEIA